MFHPIARAESEFPAQDARHFPLHSLLKLTEMVSVVPILSPTCIKAFVQVERVPILTGLS